MDFLVAGRSFLDDMHKFVIKTYSKAVKCMLNARSKSTKLKDEERLTDICQQLQNNTYEYSGTDAYREQENILNRRGENETPFYPTMKLNSERTVVFLDKN